MRGETWWMHRAVWRPDSGASGPALLLGEW